MSQIVSFHLATFPARRTATRMISVLAERWEITQAPGCELGKVLGTSATGTTRISADLRRWAILAVWSSPDAYARFVRESTVLNRWRAGASILTHFELSPVQSRGSWDGVEPFRL